jgi:hypothetical protein
MLDFLKKNGYFKADSNEGWCVFTVNLLIPYWQHPNSTPNPQAV